MKDSYLLKKVDKTQRIKEIKMRFFLKITILALLISFSGCSGKPEQVEHFENGGALECSELEYVFWGDKTTKRINSNNAVCHVSDGELPILFGPQKGESAPTTYYTFKTYDGDSFYYTACKIQGEFLEDFFSFDFLIYPVILLIIFMVVISP